MGHLPSLRISIPTGARNPNRNNRLAKRIVRHRSITAENVAVAAMIVVDGATTVAVVAMTADRGAIHAADR